MAPTNGNALSQMQASNKAQHAYNANMVNSNNATMNGVNPTGPQVNSLPANAGMRDVKSGDTLWAIAKENLGDGATDADIQNRVYQLMQANGIDSPTSLRAGQTLNTNVEGVQVTDRVRSDYRSSDVTNKDTKSELSMVSQLREGMNALVNNANLDAAARNGAWSQMVGYTSQQIAGSTEQLPEFAALLIEANQSGLDIEVPSSHNTVLEANSENAFANMVYLGDSKIPRAPFGATIEAAFGAEASFDDFTIDPTLNGVLGAISSLITGDVPEQVLNSSYVSSEEKAISDTIDAATKNDLVSLGNEVKNISEKYFENYDPDTLSYGEKVLKNVEKGWKVVSDKIMLINHAQAIYHIEDTYDYYKNEAKNRDLTDPYGMMDK